MVVCSMCQAVSAADLRTLGRVVDIRSAKMRNCEILFVFLLVHTTHTSLNVLLTHRSVYDADVCCYVVGLNLVCLRNITFRVLYLLPDRGRGGERRGKSCEASNFNHVVWRRNNLR
jgi:phage-related holin